MKRGLLPSTLAAVAAALAAGELTLEADGATLVMSDAYRLHFTPLAEDAVAVTEWHVATLFGEKRTLSTTHPCDGPEAVQLIKAMRKAIPLTLPAAGSLALFSAEVSA